MIRAHVRCLGAVADRCHKFIASRTGSITVEAAILLPCLMALVMFMVSLIQIASVELALQSAVSDTGKNVAGNWLPVRMVYTDAKARVSGTAAGGWSQEAWNRLESLHGQWSGGESWLLQYESLLPEAIVDLLKWEMQKRVELEASAQDHGEAAVHRITDPLLCRAFEPILRHYANGKLLHDDKLHVQSIVLPSLEASGNPYVELTARYEFNLPIPFWNQSIVLERKSYERAWVGNP